MNLVYYEFQKLVNKKLLLIMLPVLLLISMLLYVQSEWKERSAIIMNKTIYQQLEKPFLLRSQADGAAYAKAKVEELSFYLLLSDEAIIATINPAWKQSIEEEKKLKPKLVEQYQLSAYADDPSLLRRDLQLYEELNKQFVAIQHYNTNALDMKSRAASMLSVSIFNQQDSFSRRNIEKTLHDFAPLQTLPLQLGMEYGIVTSTSFLPVDVSLVLIIFMMTGFIFHHEKDAGLLNLIAATKRGRLDTAVAKLFVASSGTIILTVICYGTLFLIAYFMYGFGNLERYIQSMPSFKESAYGWTVEQYLLRYVGLKLLACWLITLGMSALFTCFRRAEIVYLLMLAVIAISSLLYYTIHPNSYANSLKYLNITAFIDTFQLVGVYRNIHLFGYPVSKPTLSYLVGGALILIFGISTVLLYMFQIHIAWHLPFHRVWNYVQTWWFKLRRRNSLLLHEWYKLMVLNKGWLVILLCGCFLLFTMQSESRRFLLDEAMYNQYLIQLSGELTDAKKQFIEEERQYFNQLGAEQHEWGTKLATGEVNLLQYRAKESEWMESGAKQKAFKLVDQQYQYLLEMEERTGIQASFVNSITSGELFERKSRDIQLGLQYLGLMSILLGTLFTQDYRNNSVVLLHSTQYGRGIRVRTKIVIAYFLCLFTLVITYSPMYIKLLSDYPAMDWQATIQSIENYGELRWPVSIIQYVIITNLFMLVGCLWLIHIVHALSILVRKLVLCLMLQATVLLSPMALLYLGLDQIIPYTFNGVFMLTTILHTVAATRLVLLYYAAMLVICVSAYIYGRYRANSPITRKE